MSPANRQLLRTKSNSASVVGLVPEKLLLGNDGNGNAQDEQKKAAYDGRISETSSGGIDVTAKFAYLVTAASIRRPKTSTTKAFSTSSTSASTSPTVSSNPAFQDEKEDKEVWIEKEEDGTRGSTISSGNENDPDYGIDGKCVTHVWSHITRTPSENLIPAKLSFSLIHSNYYTNPNTNPNTDTDTNTNTNHEQRLRQKSFSFVPQWHRDSRLVTFVHRLDDGSSTNTATNTNTATATGASIRNHNRMEYEGADNTSTGGTNGNIHGTAQGMYWSSPFGLLCYYDLLSVPPPQTYKRQSFTSPTNTNHYSSTIELEPLVTIQIPLLGQHSQSQDTNNNNINNNNNNNNNINSYSTTTQDSQNIHEVVTFVKALNASAKPIINHITNTNTNTNTAQDIILVATSHHNLWICQRLPGTTELHLHHLYSPTSSSTDSFAKITTEGLNPSTLLGNMYKKIKNASAITLLTQDNPPNHIIQPKQMDTHPNATYASNHYHNGVISILTPLHLSTVTRRPQKTPKPYNHQFNKAIFHVILRNGQIQTWALSTQQSKTLKSSYKLAHTLTLDHSNLKHAIQNIDHDPFQAQTKILQHNLTEVLEASINNDGTCILLALRLAFSNIVQDDKIHQNQYTRGIYLLTCPVDPNQSTVSIGQGAWLGRYPANIISSQDTLLQCTGLALIESTHNAFEDGSETDIMAYSTWQCKEKSPCAKRQHQSVSVYTARFYASSSTNQTFVTSRDFDLPYNIIPSVVPGLLFQDAITNGCVLVSSTGLVVDTRVTFPPTFAPCLSKINQSVKQDIVGELAGHLLVAFHSYFNRHGLQYKTDDIGDYGIFHDDPSTSLPQTLLVANCATLTCAAAEACLRLTNADTSTEAYNVTSLRKKSSPSLSGRRNQQINRRPSNIGILLSNIQSKLHMHKTFVHFLLRAGLYKDIQTQGRLVARDIGIRISAIECFIRHWQNVILSLGTEINTLLSPSDTEGIEFILSAIDSRPSDLPKHISDLQKLTSLQNLFDHYGSITHLFYSAIYGGTEYCKEYSESLYDLPISHNFTTNQNEKNNFYISNGENHIIWRSWTSDDCTLNSLKEILISLRNEKVPTSEDFNDILVCLTSTLLDGHREIFTLGNDDGERYDYAKKLGINLVWDILLNNKQNGKLENDPAFLLSLKHGYFEGVIRRCHQLNGPRHDANIETSKFYDLNFLMSSVALRKTDNYDDIQDEDNNEAHLCEKMNSHLDFSTSLTFPKYVFHWLAEKRMYGTLLKLGQTNCMDILSEYLEEDTRLSEFRWIKHIKNGAYADATSSLKDIAESGLEGVVFRGLQEDKYETLSLSLSNLARLCL